MELLKMRRPARSQRVYGRAFDATTMLLYKPVHVLKHSRASVKMPGYDGTGIY
jgi:hypothetical protein